MVALNSNCEQVGGCGADSPMVAWLRAHLAANPVRCTLAYFHHPLFSSGEHGNQHQVRPIWNVLYVAGADVVVNGHEHSYECFAPQTPGGVRASKQDIRQFVIETGGKELRPFGPVKPNSLVRNASSFGVLKLALRSGDYAWKFVPAAGKTYTDSGRGACH